jgi:hypothetical protein
LIHFAQDAFNLRDGSYPILDLVTGNPRGGGLHHGGGGGRGGGGGGMGCPPPDCWANCNAVAKKKWESCQESVKNFIKAMKAKGCPRVSCNVPGLAKTCNKRKQTC